MTAYDFAKLLTSGAVSSLNAEIEVVDNKYRRYNEQFWDADVSHVDHTMRKVVLASHLDYDGDSNWINTAISLKDWFIENNVEKSYKIVFQNHDSETFNDIKVAKTNVMQLA